MPIFTVKADNGQWPSEVIDKIKSQKMDKPSVITVIGQNSGMAIELDLEMVATLSGWFVQSAPSEQRSLQNVTRVIHLKDNLESLIKEELTAGASYIEKRALDRLSKDVMNESDLN